LPGTRCSFRSSWFCSCCWRDARRPSQRFGLARSTPRAIRTAHRSSGAAVVVGGGCGIVWATGFASYNDPGQDAAGLGDGSRPGHLGNLVFVGADVPLAEEVGWRGYRPKLVPAAGAVPAMALTGLMRRVSPAADRAPHPYHPDGNRLIVIPLFAAFTIGGLPYGYLRLCNSTWPGQPGALDPQLRLVLFGSPIVATSPWRGVPGWRERISSSSATVRSRRGCCGASVRRPLSVA
jgi:hypothetical protein